MSEGVSEGVSEVQGRRDIEVDWGQQGSPRESIRTVMVRFDFQYRAELSREGMGACIHTLTAPWLVSSTPLCCFLAAFSAPLLTGTKCYRHVTILWELILRIHTFIHTFINTVVHTVRMNPCNCTIP